MGYLGVQKVVLSDPCEDESGFSLKEVSAFIDAASKMSGVHVWERLRVRAQDGVILQMWVELTEGDV